MSLHKFYNPNPARNRVGDCTVRAICKATGQDWNRFTVEDFCRDHPEGTYILAIDGHVVCAVDGFYYDSWDSGQEVPVYYWTRGD